MTTDKTGAATSVADNPDAHRYEIVVEPGGERLFAGFAEYRDRVIGTDADRVPNRVFFHTEVAAEFGGRGLATILVREAIEDARARGFKIVGVCPLVAAFLKKNPEYDQATSPVTPATLEWLRAHTS